MLGHEELNHSNSALMPPPPASRRPNLGELAEQQLRSSPYLALRHVSCDVHEDTIVLRGYLPSYYLKQMAQSLVARVSGVEQVVNQIEVLNPPVRRTIQA